MFSQQNVELYFTLTKFSLHKTSKDGKTTFLHPVKIDIKMYFVELNAKWISFELKFKPLLFNLLKLSQCLYSKLKMCFCSETIILKMANNSFDLKFWSWVLSWFSIPSSLLIDKHYSPQYSSWIWINIWDPNID